MTIANDHAKPRFSGLAGFLDLLATLGVTVFSFLACVNFIASIFGAGFFAQDGEWTPFIVMVAGMQLARWSWADKGEAFNAKTAQALARQEAVKAGAEVLDHQFKERVLNVIKEANARGRGWYTPPDNPA